MDRYKGWVKRLEHAATEDAVRILQRDGSVKLFDKMHVQAEIFLAQLDAAVGRSREQPSDVMDSLDNAPPQIRKQILREHSGPFMADLEPAEPGSGPPPDFSE